MTAIRSLVIFDGDCSFCHASVQYIHRHDPDDHIYFCSMHSLLGRYIHATYGPFGDTMLLIQDGAVWSRSDAAIRIGMQLGGWHSLACVLLGIPACVRNMFYDCFARIRHQVMRQSQCMLPTAAFSAKVIG